MRSHMRTSTKTQPEPSVEPPLYLGGHSNGEHFHAATDHERLAHRLILEASDLHARRVGLDLPSYLSSPMGMVTSLSVMNRVAGQQGSRGGYELPAEAREDRELARRLLDTSDQFIFDVQTHHVNPRGSWRKTNPVWQLFLALLPQGRLGPDPVECFGVAQYIEQMFLNSDTTLAVLSGVPAALCTGSRTLACGNPLQNDEIAESREIVNLLAESQRLINHCMILPNVDLEGQLEVMQRVHEERSVAAWKCYPPWGPQGVGWWLDDEKVGIPFIEQARALGVRLICIHKGLPLPTFDAVHTDPRDIGPVAKLFPDVNFVVYHSAHRHGQLNMLGAPNEGPYDPSGQVDPRNPKRYPRDRGVNSLIDSLQAAGIGPGSNVYAELGTTWREVMTEPLQAQHVLGKLLKYVGEDNVLWGTDSIWFGSPQDQIEAFVSLSISEELQEAYGYPELTDSIKRKILGLNAARVYGVDPAARRHAIEQGELAQMKRFLDGEHGDRRWTAQKPNGPRSQREYLAYLRETHGQPG